MVLQQVQQPQRYSYTDEASLGEDIAISIWDLVATHEFWIGVAFTVSVLGLLALLKGRTHRGGGGR